MVKVEVSFLLVGGANRFPDAFIDGPGKAMVPVSMTAVAKSTLYAYEGPNPFVLNVPDKTAKTGRRSVASIPMPIGIKRALILLAPGPTSQAGPTYTGTAVEDEWVNVPAGTMRFLNYSGKPVAIKVGTQSFELAKGPSKAIPAAKPGSEVTEVPVQIAAKEGDTYRPSYNAKIKIDASERQTMIILPPKHLNGPGISVISMRDFLPPPPPAAPARRKG